MDCDTARLLLQFSRPRGSELDEPERSDLDAHLAGCPDCHGLAASQRRLDDVLGEAMRAVEVPPHLKAEILHRVAAERGDWWRRRVGGYARGLAAAAAMLLLVWGWYTFYRPARPELSAEEVFVSFNVSRPGRDEINEQLRQLGSVGGAPAFVDYAYLTGSPSLAVLPGTQDAKTPVKAPQLIFAAGAQRVVLFIVPQRDYRVEDLNNPAHGYTYRIDVVRPEDDARFVYLLLHTGDSWDWLRVVSSNL